MSAEASINGVNLSSKGWINAAWPHKHSNVLPTTRPRAHSRVLTANVHYTRTPTFRPITRATYQQPCMFTDGAGYTINASFCMICRPRVLTSAHPLRLINAWFNSRHFDLGRIETLCKVIRRKKNITSLGLSRHTLKSARQIDFLEFAQQKSTSSYLLLHLELFHARPHFLGIVCHNEILGWRRKFYLKDGIWLTMRWIPKSIAPVLQRSWFVDTWSYMWGEGFGGEEINDCGTLNTLLLFSLYPFILLACNIYFTKKLRGAAHLPLCCGQGMMQNPLWI